MALFCGHCQKYYDPGDPSKIIGCDCDGAVAYRKSKIDDKPKLAFAVQEAQKRCSKVKR